MRTSKWLVITLAASVVAGGFTVLKARAEDIGARRGGLQFLQRAKEKLGLTDEQTAKIKAELVAEKEPLKTLLVSLHDARVALRETIQKSGSSEAEIRAASAKVASVEADLAVERAKLYAKISPILTAEQLAKISAFQEKVDDFIDNAISGLGNRLAAQ